MDQEGLLTCTLCCLDKQLDGNGICQSCAVDYELTWPSDIYIEEKEEE
jgi:hypothetical protein